VDDLPEIVRLFPLPNVVLFPDVDLPLHIFEARYRDMVHDALEDDRLVGMVLLRGDWRKDYLGSPEVYPLGCVGRIEAAAKESDGRFNLVLHGLRGFEIVEEVGGRPYRCARVRWRPPEPRPCRDISPATQLRLRSSVYRLIERARGEVPKDLWERLPSDADKMINNLAFSLDLSEIEKLALLDCGDVPARAERLVEVIEFRLAEHLLGQSATRDERRH
jgi:Lon protease-like protein